MEEGRCYCSSEGMTFGSYFGQMSAPDGESASGTLSECESLSSTVDAKWRHRRNGDEKAMGCAAGREYACTANLIQGLRAGLAVDFLLLTG